MHVCQPTTSDLLHLRALTSARCLRVKLGIPRRASYSWGMSVDLATGHDAALAESSPTSVAELRRRLRQSEDRVAWIQDICEALRAYERQDDLLDYVVDRLSRIMNAERTTLFLLDHDGQHLWSRVAIGGDSMEIRLALGEGIAGWVALHGKSVNLKDASKDPRFVSRYDERTGFQTRSLLCQPMRNKDGVVIGVVQSLNKRDGYFSVEDATLLSAITNTASIVIENQRLYLEAMDTTLELVAARRALEQRVKRLDTLYEIQRNISELDDLDAIVAHVAESMGTAIASNGSAITLFSEDAPLEFAFVRRSQKDVFRQARRPWGMGSRDQAIEQLAPVRASERDATTGRVVPTLAVPLQSNDRVIGCIELYDRCGTDVFAAPEYSEEDLRLVSLVAAQIAPAVARRLNAARRERQARLSAIGHMLSGVTHDMKTPLAVSRGYLQLMAKASDTEKRERYVDAIMQQFDHMNGMLGEMLAYARGETRLYLRKVQLSVFAAELQEQLEQEFADRDVSVSVEAEYRGEARFDDGKLTRVLFNFARNAREAMQDGGTYTVRFEREGDELVVRNIDTGPGIPEAIQDRLFEAFVTAGKANNTGLGLAIVKRLVDEHNGSISFQSSPGVGTEFVVRLPLTPE